MKWIPLYLKRKLSHDKTGMVLSVVSILAGICLFISTSICRFSAEGYFTDYITNQYSGAEVVVKNNQMNKFDYSVVIPGVEKILAMNQAESYFYDEHDGSYYTYELFSLDVKGELEVDSFEIYVGTEPGDGECLIPRSMSDKSGVKKGDEIVIRTAQGELLYRVAGILEDQGIASGDKIIIPITDPEYAQVYKLVINPDTDPEKIVMYLQQILSNDFEIEYTENLSNDFLDGVISFFNILYAFSIVILLLGVYITYITMHGYIEDMKYDISMLKVMGANSFELISAILCLGVMIAVLGSAGGIAGALALSRLMLRTIAAGFGGDLIFKYSIPMNSILTGTLLIFLVCIVTAFIVSWKYINRHIISEMNSSEHVRDIKKIKVVSVVMLVLCSVIRCFFIEETAARLSFNILLYVIAMFVIVVIFYRPLILWVIANIPFISGKNQILVKQNLIRGIRQNYKIVLLLTIMTALGGSMYSVFEQVKVTMDNMVENSYFGDMVITSVVGRMIDEETLEEIEKIDTIEQCYPVLQNYVEIKDTQVQVAGYELDDLNVEYLNKRDNFGDYELHDLLQKNTIMISNRIMKVAELQVGDSISINGEQLKIIGSFSTVQNNGRAAIVSRKNFHDIFQEYETRHINIFIRDGYGAQDINDRVKSATGNEFLTIKSVPEVIQEESKQTAQFIYLIYGILILLCVVNGLIIINIITNENKNNAYGASVIKGLGEIRGESMRRSAIYGAIFWSFSSALGISGACVISYNLCRLMNELMEWDIAFRIGHIEIISAFYLILIIGTEIITTGKRYKKSVTTLFEESKF